MNTIKNSFILLMSFLLLHVLQLSAQSNQYLHFDRVDDYVILDNASQYFSGTNQLTMTGWFYLDELAYGQGYMGFRSGAGNAEFYLIQLNNGVMECRLRTTTGLHEYVSPVNTAIPQVWQHFAWVFDVNTIRLYVNGVLKGSAAASGIFQGENVAFGIGKSLLGGFNFVYGGRIDEVAVWRRVLSQDEIQDLMDNEADPSDTDLELYYKFNQGEPGGDNTSITKLICEIGGGERDADLMNFAMTGETSNFNGELDPSYQAISFPQIPNHLTTDPPFEIEATATSGLPVSFEIISGPATINGNIISLTGEEGKVTVRATQEGDQQYDPAIPVDNSFMVLNPATYVPEVDVRHPLPGNLYMPELAPVQLSAKVSIGYPELFSVKGVYFEIDGQVIASNNFYNNGYYTGWWTPSSYGTHTIGIVAKNNYGAQAVQNVSISINANATDMSVVAAEDIWINPSNVTQVVEAELPSFLGAFDQVTATMEVSCPPGGCGEWDRKASVDAQGIDGRWFEIIRYITPYGVACSHTIDLTDYISLLQGKVNFRFNCETLDNGFKYKLTLNYRKGTPSYLYSTIYEVWKEVYPFGDYANLQPVEDWSFSFPDHTLAARLKLVSTGHGWGDLNTGNAAEFYNATHHIWVNGEETFAQHNWSTCNPNPDGCQPQNGTWYHNRAGWCPGSIAPWFDFNLTPYVANGQLTLGYVFFENYVDLCHPNHPDCVTGVTCADCNDGFNPVLDVACNLVIYSSNPLVGTGSLLAAPSFIVKPNPTTGWVEISTTGTEIYHTSTISLYHMSGRLLEQFEWNGQFKRLDLTKYPKGVYMLRIGNNGKQEVKKLIVK
ncbi:MAG: T9SS type A sorting domain-containing protein [Bacteroidales bacterium]|nr:T9SS type A sorting domain-containing protein [Bacteroidales bacterium]